MKIGITFGGYCPLHQGHLGLIMRAKKENDKAHVIVCGYDNDRGGSVLPLSKRKIIITNYFKTDPLITVDCVNDTELGLDESFSEENWRIWVRAIMKIVFPKDIDDLYDTDFTWYVGEDNYVQAIKNAWNWNLKQSEFADLIELHPLRVELMDRQENLVSGTLCRKYPLKYWDKITQPFRAYWSHNILISGTASEGKTTLTQDIGRYFCLPFSYEKGRDICNLKSDPDFTFKDFLHNIYEQNKYNEQLICSPLNPGIFVSDTDNMVTLMYAKAYAERDGFAITPEQYENLHNVVAEYAKTIKWDKIFLLKPSKKGIVDDGQRYMEDSDYEIRVKFYEYLKSLYDTFGYEYEELDGGDYYINFCKVRDYIRSLYEK